LILLINKVSKEALIIKEDELYKYNYLCAISRLDENEKNEL